ncbi:MAG: hypothetical protein ACW967_08650 [Candidatus Hodarchaeales archaeon]|jgi:hypothetical protein
MKNQKFEEVLLTVEPQIRPSIRGILIMFLLVPIGSILLALAIQLIALSQIDVDSLINRPSVVTLIIAQSLSALLQYILIILMLRIFNKKFQQEPSYLGSSIIFFTIVTALLFRYNTTTLPTEVTVFVFGTSLYLLALATSSFLITQIRQRKVTQFVRDENGHLKAMSKNFFPYFLYPIKSKFEWQPRKDNVFLFSIQKLEHKKRSPLELNLSPSRKSKLEFVNLEIIQRLANNSSYNIDLMGKSFELKPEQFNIYLIKGISDIKKDDNNQGFLLRYQIQAQEILDFFGQIEANDIEYHIIIPKMSWNSRMKRFRYTISM